MKWSIILLFTIFTHLTVQSQDLQEQFVKAYEQYEMGDSRKCILALQSLERQTGANPRIYSLYVRAYLLDKDYINAKISLNRFRVLVGSRKTESIQAILDLEKEVDAGLDDQDSRFKLMVEKSRMEEANKVIEQNKNINKQKVVELNRLYTGGKKEIEDENQLLFRFYENGKFGYKNEDGKVVIAPRYQDALDFSDENLAPVKQNGKWGHINRRNQVVTPFVYESVDHFYNERAVVSLNRYYGFVNVRGELVIPTIYEDVLNFSEGEDLTKVKKNGRWFKIDLNGKESAPEKYDFIGEKFNGRRKVSLTDKYGYLNDRDELVIPLKYDNAKDFKEGYAAVKLNNKWGFINNAGKEITEFKYHLLYDFRGGLAWFTQYIGTEILYGLLDTSGKEVVPAKYLMVGDFSDGLAAVWVKGTGDENKVGFINTKGEMVIPAIYDSVEEDFTNGKAKVIRNKETFYIDKNGKRVL